MKPTLSNIVKNIAGKDEALKQAKNQLVLAANERNTAINALKELLPLSVLFGQEYVFTKSKWYQTKPYTGTLSNSEFVGHDNKTYLKHHDIMSGLKMKEVLLENDTLIEELSVLDDDLYLLLIVPDEFDEDFALEHQNDNALVAIRPVLIAEYVFIKLPA